MPRNAPAKTASKSSTKAKAPPRSSSTAATDVLKLLAEDHKKVTKMFDQFEKLKADEEADEEEKQLLVETACAELTIHAQVEEEIFYPAAREAIEDLDLLDEAEVEHASAKQLITELSAMQPGDDLYDAKFTVLGEYVKHHIEEEEKELFPKVKKAKLDLEALAEEIQQRKIELREELGIASDEDEEEDGDDDAKSSPRKDMH